MGRVIGHQLHMVTYHAICQHVRIFEEVFKIRSSLQEVLFLMVTIGQRAKVLIKVLILLLLSDKEVEGFASFFSWEQRKGFVAKQS